MFGRKFPSIEVLMREFLEPRLSVPVTAELPPGFELEDGPTDGLPAIHVERISGADIDPVLDRPIVDIDCYGLDRATSQDLAEAVRAQLRFELPGTAVSNVVFTRTRTVVGPRLLVHANPKVRRYSGVYEFALHPQP